MEEYWIGQNAHGISFRLIEMDHCTCVSPLLPRSTQKQLHGGNPSFLWHDHIRSTGVATESASSGEYRRIKVARSIHFQWLVNLTAMEWKDGQSRSGVQSARRHQHFDEIFEEEL